MGARNGNLGVSNTSYRPELLVDDVLFPKNVENDAFRTDFDRARCNRVVNWRLKRLSCRSVHPPRDYAKSCATKR